MEDEGPSAVYRQWLESFGNKINTLGTEDFETPFRLTSGTLVPLELEGECLEWTRRYLSLHDCPNGLVYQLSRAVFKSVKGSINMSRFTVDFGDECGGEEEADDDISDNASQESSDELDGKAVPPPLLSASKLLSEVVSHIHSVVKSWNVSPPALVSPPTSLHVCSHAIKNVRRKMEDRHVIITDVNTLFDIKDMPHQSYFAVFDGHGGIEAADYAAAHLHTFLMADPHFASDPAGALKRAYKTTDLRFLEKAKRTQGVRSGSTGVTVLVRGDELYVAWLGDSQALLVRGGQPVQVMDPHKPEREDERQRIEELGGCVLFFGTWRVNGNIAVARAIGDAAHKPFISSDADVTCLQMTSEDEYLVLACDGLWDVLTPSQVTNIVYKHSHTSPGGLDDVAIGLVNAARDSGSSDNISVVVVLFKSKLSVPQETIDGGILLGSTNMVPENVGEHSSTSSGSNVGSSMGDPQPKPPTLNKNGKVKGNNAKDEMLAATCGSVEFLSSTLNQTPFTHRLIRQPSFYVNASPRKGKLQRDPNLALLALRQAVSGADKNRQSRKHKHVESSVLTAHAENSGSFAKRSGRKETRRPKARSLSRQPMLHTTAGAASFSKKKKNHGNNNNVMSFSLALPGGGPTHGETMWGYSDDSDDAWSVSTGLSDTDWSSARRSHNAALDLAALHGNVGSRKGEPTLSPLRGLKGSSLLQAAISVEASTMSNNTSHQWAKNSPLLHLSGTTLQLSNRATLPQILPCVPATPQTNHHNSYGKLGSATLHLSPHQQVVPPLWNRRLSSLGEMGDNDVSNAIQPPPPSLGPRKLSVLSDTGLSRSRRRSAQSKDSVRAPDTSRRAKHQHHNHYL